MNGFRNDNGQKKNSSNVFTPETLGVVLIIFSALCLVCVISRGAVFSVPGEIVCDFLIGVFGYSSILVLLTVFCLGFMLIFGKKLNVSFKNKFLFTVCAVFTAILLHLISMNDYSGLSYGEYLKKAYELGDGGLKGASCGGLVLSLIVYLFSSLLTNVGAYVVVSLILATLLFFFAKNVQKSLSGTKEPQLKASSVKNDEVKIDGIDNLEEREYPVDNLNYSQEKAYKQTLFVINPDDFALKSKRELKKNNDSIKIEYGMGGLGVGNTESYSANYSKDFEDKLKFIKTPASLNIPSTKTSYERPSSFGNGEVKISQPIKDFYSNFGNHDVENSHLVKDVNNEDKNETKSIPLYEHDESEAKDSAGEHALEFSDKYADIPETDAPIETFTNNSTYSTTPINISSEKKPENVPEETISFNSPAFNEKSEEPKINSTPSSERAARQFNFFDEMAESNEIKPDEKIETRSETADNLSTDSQVFKLNDFNKTEENLDKNSENQEAESFSLPKREPRSRRERFDFSNDGNMNIRRRTSPISDFSSHIVNSESQTPIERQPIERKIEKPKKEIPPINRKYHRPPLDLLESYEQTQTGDTENHEERMEIIKRTLEEFHISANPESFVQGPAVTRYEIKMPAGVSVKKVLSLDDDLRMRLASKSGIRIEAPIPGKDLVGIEVANRVKVTVGLKEILEQAAKKPTKPNALMFALGKNIVGDAITDNLAKGPHYLVAGATGSGKSVCLNVMIISMIMKYSPEELRLLLVDPKSVGFRIYEHLPHLMIDEIITEPQKALAMLQWAYIEMERRYQVFKECDQLIMDIEAYNERIAGPTVAKMPRIVIIIDELADLMETCKKDMENKIRALAQKSRAAGIHLVLATQRPSVDIITGTIKANLPSRIALKVMNFQDSNTILSEGGAEKLLGNGDMLYKNSSMAEYERYQGAWISDLEITGVVNYIKENNKAYFDDELTEYLENAIHPKVEESSAGGDGGEDSIENDDLFKRSLSYGITAGTISISMIQRRFSVGFSRAGRIVDAMERLSYIGPNEGNSKGRKVIISREEYESKYGPMMD